MLGDKVRAVGRDAEASQDGGVSLACCWVRKACRTAGLPGRVAHGPGGLAGDGRPSPRGFAIARWAHLAGFARRTGSRGALRRLRSALPGALAVVETAGGAFVGLELQRFKFQFFAQQFFQVRP